MFHRTPFRARAVIIAIGTLGLELFVFARTSLPQPQQSVTANERIENGAQLTVRLLGDDGQPVSSNVCLRGEDGWEACSTADRLGTITFFRLAAKSYVVIVFRGSQQIWTDQVTITDRFAIQSEMIRLPGSQSASPAIFLKDLAVPKRATKLYDAGKKALYKGEYSKAQKSFQAALSSHPSSPRARNALAVVYVKQHDFSSAMEQLEIAIKLDSRFGEAYFNYGIVLMDTSRYSDAATYLGKALDLEFSTEHVADCLISCELHADRPDDAVAALQTIHKRNLKHRAQAKLSGIQKQRTRIPRNRT